MTPIFIKQFVIVSRSVSAIPGSESCFLKQAVRFEVRDWESKDVAIVRVMLQYLSNEVSAEQMICSTCIVNFF